MAGAIVPVIAGVPCIAAPEVSVGAAVAAIAAVGAAVAAIAAVGARVAAMASVGATVAAIAAVEATVAAGAAAVVLVGGAGVSVGVPPHAESNMPTVSIAPARDRPLDLKNLCKAVPPFWYRRRTRYQAPDHTSC